MRLAEVHPWTREQRKCGNGQTVRSKAKERRSDRGNKGGDSNSYRTNDRMWRSQKRPDDQTEEVRPGRGSHDQPRVRTYREEVKQNSNHWENWKTQPSWEPQKFPRGNGTTGSDSNTDRPRGGRKANYPRERECRSDWTQPEQSEWDTSAQGRGNDHQALTHQNYPPTRKRDEWKVSTRTEGDSKAPSASTATSTSRKAGARGKQTGTS